jgi:hypothetical protein
VVPVPPRKLGLDALWLAALDRPTSLFIGLLLTFFPLLQLPFFLFVFRPLLEERNDATIVAQGKPAMGEVLRVDDASNLSINGRRPARVFFRYKADGAEHEGSMLTLSTAEVAKWQKGKPVAVRYLGERATLADLEPAAFPFPAWAMMAALVANGCVGVPILAYAIIGLRWKYRVLADGVARPGKLISFEALSSFGSWHQWGRFRATYSYTDSAGRDVVGTATSRDLTLLNGKQKGDEIELLVVPADERRSTIIDSAVERTIQRA